MDSLFNIIAGGFALLGITFLILAALFYFLTSYGLYKLAKNRNISLAFLAFIPFFQLYIVGLLIDQKIKIGKASIPYAHLILPIAPILISCLIGSGLYTISNIAFYILNAFAVYNLYQKYMRNNQVAMTLLSVLLPITYPFIIFSIRNNQVIETEYNYNRDTNNFGNY